MKRILFALMAVATIAMMGSVAGCKSKGEPDPEDNIRNYRGDTNVMFQVNLQF